MLVGDPRQLPPTVLSTAAQEAGLDVSLFDRLDILGVKCALNPLPPRPPFTPATCVSRFDGEHGNIYTVGHDTYILSLRYIKQQLYH